MSEITLRGGPADGEVIEAPPVGTRIGVGWRVPPKRLLGPDDELVTDELGIHAWADPDCNATYQTHLYTIAGEYIRRDT